MDKSSLGLLLCLVVQGAFAQYDPMCTGEDGQPLSGPYPFPDECISEYFNCLEGSLASTKCPDDNIFDPLLLECVHEDQASCLSGSEGTTDETTDITEDPSSPESPEGTTEDGTTDITDDPSSPENSEGTLFTDSTPSETFPTTDDTSTEPSLSTDDTISTDSATSTGASTTGQSSTSSGSSTQSATTTTQKPTNSPGTDPTGPPNTLEELQTTLYIVGGVLGVVSLILIGGVAVLFLQINGVNSKLKKLNPSSGKAAKSPGVSDDITSRFNVYQPGGALPRPKLN